MVWPLLAGVGVAGALIGSRMARQAYTAWRQAGGTMFGQRYYEGGFEAVMNKREAARILGIRASADKTKLMERYRTLMKNNHPDSGGSPYLAKKINEAKDLLVKGKSGKLAS
ncbi:J domain-containing protein [Plasmodiophora brassicae]|uniref:J domain-containing protein n=1 Tax=Plasmodiophora brassicae TaxID=37360 RepID=A0A3P3YC64_PLABS|nr:unnamed protein product [Plasmodiophora brassicae]